MSRLGAGKLAECSEDDTREGRIRINWLNRSVGLQLFFKAFGDFDYFPTSVMAISLRSKRMKIDFNASTLPCVSSLVRVDL